MDIDIDFIRRELQRRRDERQMSAVAKGAHLNRRTLDYILAGRSGHFDTLTKLQTYLKANVRKKRLDDADHK